MQTQISFWKKYEFFIIAAITVIIIYLIVIFNQKINFFLGNELIVSLQPHESSFSLHYGDVQKIEFNVSADNVAYCKAACSYTFNDRSTNRIIDKGNFELEKGQHFTKNYELSVKKLGSGQDIYSFDAQCRSIRSSLCLTASPEKFRSSLVTVNYDLTETEKQLKQILRQNITKLLEQLSETEVLHQQVNQKYFELGIKVNMVNLSKQKIDIDDEYDKTRIAIENLRSLWSVEDYARLNQKYNESFLEKLRNIENSIIGLNESIDNIVDIHNSLLANLNILQNQLKELDYFAEVLEDENISKQFDLLAANFTQIEFSLKGNSLKNYSSIAENILNLTNQKNMLMQNSLAPSASLFFNSQYHLRFYKDYLCSLRQDCIEEVAIGKTSGNTEQFIYEYPNSTLLNESCNSLKELNQTYSAIKNESNEAISKNNISFPENSEFLSAAISFKDNEIRKINNSYYESFEAIVSENKTSLGIINLINQTLPKGKAGLIQINYNQSINLSLHLLSKLNLSDDALILLVKCSNLEKPTDSAINFSYEPIPSAINYKIISRIDANLSDNLPVCCVFNDCKPCCRDDSCRNDPKTFPIIFLHGHSFAKDNSPEFSLDSFNKLQSKLQDDGYLNAGIVSLYSQNEQVQNGVWGLSGKPVTVKVSYYYDAFRKDDKYIVVPTKSENIDTYAVRLKELIGIVKQRTDKPKVNIIAHSMGGLVARRYIQIFGEEDIDKLIMIATPNYGISGAVSDYCGFVGENRECNDMKENSLFLNKLNDKLKQPNKVKLYDVIGRGCDMKLGNGDGVVLAENAKLKNAELHYVNGTCESIFGSDLHTEILDIDKYNETYEVINEILRE